MSNQPFRIVFAIFDDVAQLDFTGPLQFLNSLPNSVTIVASHAGGIVRGDGLAFAETVRLSDIGKCDLICVPGGPGTLTAASNPNFIKEVRRLALSATYVTSVCTGSLILGAAGLLRGKRAACHWAWRHLLPAFEAIPVWGRVVRDGNVITGGGVTAGIDFALTLLAEIAGEDTAKAVQLQLEYAPDPPYASGQPELASRAVLAAVMSGLNPILAARRAEAEAIARTMPR